MYKKEVADLLVGKYDVEQIKKLHSKWKLMNEETVTFPHQNFVSKAKEALEEVFTGLVQLKYSGEVLVLLKYSHNVYHFNTGVSLLDDIVSKKRIVFNNYR